MADDEIPEFGASATFGFDGHLRSGEVPAHPGWHRDQLGIEHPDIPGVDPGHGAGDYPA